MLKLDRRYWVDSLAAKAFGAMGYLNNTLRIFINNWNFLEGSSGQQK